MIKAILVDDERLALEWRTSKVGELLAFLIHHKGEKVSRHLIIDCLWEHFDVERATAHFHTTIYYLRQSLNSVGIKDLILHDKGFYRIDTNRIDCDYYKFDNFVSDNPVNSENIKLYENYIKLYKGGYLEGNSYPWSQQLKENLENKYMDILLRLYHYYLNEQNLPTAAKLLRKALQSNPLAEDIHAKLIRVYLLANDRVSAMKQYDALSWILKDEFGIEPGDEVRQLLNIR
ncbi:MAG TPA: BTAD domain-containing putative transcriptional regulator [Bacillota bacterium]|nr:BTAD domain-containing putative transcriptional regulator [Bacillota bacterium]